jgi:nucleoside-diphosphate-sugar epimerase
MTVTSALGVLTWSGYPREVSPYARSLRAIAIGSFWRLVMTTRREVLQLAVGVAAGGAVAPAPAVNSKPGTLLILGGTGFIGPYLTVEALRLGWKVTHFNRGKHPTGGVAGVETRIGDRNGQLDSLRGRMWDVVIDDTGYIPKFVKLSAELLAPNVGFCLYISSKAAYASFEKPNDENSPTAKLSNPDAEDYGAGHAEYGRMKALCEQYSEQAFKGRIAVVRPGFIVGPFDPFGCFTHWPVRVSKGGEMLAPGSGNDPIQVIDVRDLVVWIMKLVDSRTTGYFNADSPPGAFTMGDLIEASQQASPKSGTTVTWVSEDFLAAQNWNLDERLFNLAPWWLTKGGFAGAPLTSVERAKNTGLRSRPLQHTVRDTLAWFQSLPAERQAEIPQGGLDRQKEASLLRAWNESRAQLKKPKQG